MRYEYRVYFEKTRTHSKRAITSLLAKFPKLEVDLEDDLGVTTVSENEPESRELYSEARRLGFKSSFEVITHYGHKDALAGELGVFSAGSEGEWGKLPRDAFDFSTGCPRCGLGAAQVKPHVLSERSIRYRGTFGHGERGSLRNLMRSEIGREIIEATGQPWCMRHPVTRAGEVIEEWMEPVPCATMPPLSRKSEGVTLGCTSSLGGIGEPPVIVPPCPVCGRLTWDYDREQHTRLVYPQAAIEAAQKHAIVAMYEPYTTFPAFDPVKRSFTKLYGLPWLLFNRAALGVLAKYVQTEHVRTMSYVIPVFSE